MLSWNQILEIEFYRFYTIYTTYRFLNWVSQKGSDQDIEMIKWFKVQFWLKDFKQDNRLLRYSSLPRKKVKWEKAGKLVVYFHLIDTSWWILVEHKII